MSNILPANPTTYQKAISLLQGGQLVALPTETVYGLAGLANNDKAIKNIYEIKSRPANNPLSAIVFSKKQAGELASVSPLASKLIDAFWPGPLTLVMPRKKNAKLSDAALVGVDTIGLRLPDTDWVDAFKKSGFDQPLFLTSANSSGHSSPTTAKEVWNDLGNNIPLIVDAGPCKTGIESTILSVDGNSVKLIRAGALPASAFAAYSINWEP
jgi:L-threonylcarbamoyladenylate synthase